MGMVYVRGDLGVLSTLILVLVRGELRSAQDESQARSCFRQFILRRNAL